MPAAFRVLIQCLEPGRRYHYSASFELDGCLYVAGGDYSLNSVRRYCIASDTWIPVADMTEGSHFFGAVTIGNAGSTEEMPWISSICLFRIKSIELKSFQMQIL
jgi:hypothetical protein